MSVDKFGRFYTGSLDKFGRYGIERASGEILGISKPSDRQYSDTSIALYDSNKRFSNYVTYTKKSGVITKVTIPSTYTLLVDEIVATPGYELPIKENAKLRVHKRIDDKSAKFNITIVVKSFDDAKEVIFTAEVRFTNCRVFRFLQGSGEITQQHLPNPTEILINGTRIGSQLVGKKLVYNDVLSFYPPNSDSNCDFFFLIRSPVQK